MNLPWYQTWFNTPYYHDLYQHRDLNEAREFIESLCQKLDVKEGEIAIDVACGRGRHAQVLANQGLDTVEMIRVLTPPVASQLHINKHLLKH